jgi:restriction endonuclease S subunit
VVENLNIDLVKDIKIPIPPKNIQDEIVAKMDVAYQNKQNKVQNLKYHFLFVQLRQ